MLGRNLQHFFQILATILQQLLMTRYFSIFADEINVGVVYGHLLIWTPKTLEQSPVLLEKNTMFHADKNLHLKMKRIIHFNDLYTRTMVSVFFNLKILWQVLIMYKFKINCWFLICFRSSLRLRSKMSGLGQVTRQIISGLNYILRTTAVVAWRWSVCFTFIWKLSLSPWWIESRLSQKFSDFGPVI